MDETSTAEAPATGTVEHEPGYRYWAFISYSHADERWASWLHRSLETYKVPRAVAGTAGADGAPRPSRLFPLFRDRDELSSAASLGPKIQDALAASRNLIVICSPSAVRSPWVNEEIRAFKALGRDGRVFCLIVDGEPHASVTPGGAAQECFPEALRHSVGADGQLTSERTEPLAADARPGKDGKRNALLKLSAGLLDVGFDSLKQRDQERRTRQFAAAAAVLAVIVMVLLGLTVYAYWQKQAAQREARAARAALSGQVASHARSSLEPFPRRSLLLAVQALRITEDRAEPTVPAAKEALYHAVADTGGMVFGNDESPIVSADLSPDGRWLVTAAERGVLARLWDLASADAPRMLSLSRAAGPVAFSADSRWLVTGGRDDDPGRLWDLASAEPSASARALEAGASPFRFSPDNRWLVSGARDRSIRLWDLRSPSGTAPIVLAPHVANEVGATISPDGRWLVTHSWHGSMLLPWMDAPRLYDLTAPRPETTAVELSGHTSSVTGVLFSPDSRWLATSSAESGTGRVFRSDKRVLLRDLGKRERSAIELRGHDGPITAMAMSRDSKWLITGSADKTARVWSLAAADIGAASVTLPGHDGPVFGTVVTSEDSDKFVAITIAEGRRDGGRVDPSTARVWRLANRWPDPAVPEPTTMTHSGRPISVSAFQTTGDGGRLLLASGNTVFVVQTASPAAPPTILHAHEGEVTIATYARGGSSVVTGARDGTARLWTLDARPSVSPMVSAAEEHTVSPDGRWLVTIGAETPQGRMDSIATLSDRSTRDVATRPVLLKGHTGRIVATAFSRDSHWLVTGSYDGTVRVWDLTANDVASASLPRVHGEAVYRITISKDDRWVTPIGARTASLWDLKTADVPRVATFAKDFVALDGRWLVIQGDGQAGPSTTSVLDLSTKDPMATRRVLDGAGTPIDASRDGRWLLTSGREEMPLLWASTVNGPTPTPVRLSELARTLSRVTFSPDGRWLVTSGRDETARRWDLRAADLAASSHLLARFPSEVPEIAFSRDGRRFLASGIEAAYLWEVAEDGAWAPPIELPASFRRARFGNEALDFSPDGRHLVLHGGTTGPVRTLSLELRDLIPLACRTAGRNLTAAEWTHYFPGLPYSKTCPEG